MIQHNGYGRSVARLAILVSFTLVLAGCTGTYKGEKVMVVNGKEYVISGTVTPSQETAAVLIVTPDPFATTPAPTTTSPTTTNQPEETNMPTEISPTTILTYDPRLVQKKPTPKPIPVETAIKIAGADLYNAYAADPVAADVLYKGKLVEVTGVLIGRFENPASPRQRYLAFGDPQYVALPGEPVPFTTPGLAVDVTTNIGWMGLFGGMISGKKIGNTYTFTGHVQSFDTHVILVP